MSKLLELLGQEAYDKLKAALGDQFEDFETQYNDGKLNDADVKAKQQELGLLEDTDVEDGEGDKTEAEDGEGDKTEADNGEGDKTEPDNQQTDTSTDLTTDNANLVLLDGWLKEDGQVDYDKILDDTLKGYIKNLHERLKQVEWDYKYKMAISVEALKSNMYDPADADKFISTSELSIDDEGNVVGVKEAFNKLRETKPHLFKSTDSSNGNAGFNPAKGRKVDGYRDGMSFAEAFN